MRTKCLSSRPALHLLLIALVGFLAYSNSFHVPFILDDETSILNNKVIQDLERFLRDDGYSYNPRRFLGYLTVALNHHLGGLDVTGYHVVNLLIHTLSAWLVYALARLTLQTPFLASAASAPDAKPALAFTFIPLCAALFFVAHPIQTQAVTYVIQRLASLATLFFILSLACYAKARLLQETSGRSFGTRPVLLYLCALLAAGCAMKTKEIAFTLPFVIVLYEFFFFRMTAVKKLLFLLPITLTVLVVPLSLLGTGRPIGRLISDVTAITRVDTDISRIDYLLTQFPVIATYIRLIFLPVNQNLDYDFPIYRTLSSPPVFLSLLLLLALLGTALFLFTRSGPRGADSAAVCGGTRELRLISFGILWFFVTISVESSLIPIVDVIFEHRVYLPSVGAFVALATALSLLLRKVSAQKAALVAGAAVVALAGTTFARNQVWGSELAIWSDAVRKSPGKARPHYNLALALDKLDRTGEALQQAVLAARIDPREANPHNLIGSLLGRQGRYDDAIAALSEAVRLDPELAEAQINLGDAYRLKGMTRQALERYQIALELTPTDADIYHKIGAAHAVANNMEKAVVFFQSAANLNPARPEYRTDLQRAQAASRITAR